MSVLSFRRTKISEIFLISIKIELRISQEDVRLGWNLWSARSFGGPSGL